MYNFIILIFVFLITVSCSKETIYSGKILNQEDLNDLNFKNKNNLLKIWGNPSYIDPIEKKFFYFSEKKQKKSIFKDKIEYSFVFIFKFDDKDKILASKVYDLKNMENVELIKEETKIDIVKRGLLERIFGGVGPQTELPTTP
tara:strand:+ start:255 stop:683 length:429 start_codon:yes stop_codon:yes gene_type:complete